MLAFVNCLPSGLMLRAVRPRVSDGVPGSRACEEAILCSDDECRDLPRGDAGVHLRLPLFS